MTNAEYLDVLDRHGNFTGQKKLRADIHKDGDWHRAVHAWVVSSKGELLLQRRGPTKETNPNMLDISIAGHIEAGQTSMDTVLKEAKEELGLELTPNEPELLFSYNHKVILNNGTFINHGFHDVYLIEKDVPMQNFSMDEREVSDLLYIPWRKVKKELKSGNPEFLNHPNEFPKLFKILGQRF